MRVISSVRRRLANGVLISPLGLGLSVNVYRKSKDAPSDHLVLLNVIRKYLEEFPGLSCYYHPSVEKDRGSCLALVEFYQDLIPSIIPAAKEPHLRTLLARLRSVTSDEEHRRQLTREIAKSDLRSGVIDRAVSLKDEPDFAPTIESEINEFEKNYGAHAGMIRTSSTWSTLAPDLRGGSLVYLFNKNIEALRGKKVLHVAPEPTLRAWFEKHKAAVNISYTTLDPFSNAVDVKEDLIQTSFPDGSFDLIICHRVLEHVLDDKRALSEMYRILRHGGTLNMSVPQSTNLSKTNDWWVPDWSHDGHVRQYGLDLADRMKAAGFSSVVVDSTLLNRKLEDHVQDKTYPLRIYVCTK